MKYRIEFIRGNQNITVKSVNFEDRLVILQIMTLLQFYTVVNNILSEGLLVSIFKVNSIYISCYIENV